MKKHILLATLFSLILISSIALAGTLNVDAFNMSISYPGGWSVDEMKMPTPGNMAAKSAAQTAQQHGESFRIVDSSGRFLSGGDIASQAVGAATNTAQSAATGAIGGAVMQQMMKDVPKFDSATFTKVSSTITLSIVESKGAAADMGAPTGYTGGGKGSGGSSCATLDQSGKSWGGQSAQYFAGRCPQGSEQMYTVTAMMKRGGAQYALIGTMTSPSVDDAAFQSNLKQPFDSMLAGTTFR